MALFDIQFYWRYLIFSSIASNEIRIVGRIVKESVTICLKLDYYAGEELSKCDRKLNLDKKNRVYLRYSLRGNVKKNWAAPADFSRIQGLIYN